MDRKENVEKIFTTVANEYGFEEVSADFSPEYDLKIAWRRVGAYIDFWVSDYLLDAPASVLTGLADSVCSRIRRCGDGMYDDDVVKFLTDRKFVETNREKYLSRIGGVSKTGLGRHNDLDESYARLVDSGLLEYDPDIELRWAPMEDADAVGRASVLMKTVCINRRLDIANLAEDLLDFALYSQMCFLSGGFDQDCDSRKSTYMKNLSEYPDYEEYQSRLEVLGMTVVKEMSLAD